MRDKEGKPYTVRYEAVNAMLLNEHRTVQGQQKEIDALKAELKEQAAQIQKVSAQLAAASPSRGGLEAEQTCAVTQSAIARVPVGAWVTFLRD